MIKALLVVLSVGPQCELATLDAKHGEYLTDKDMTQVGISAKRCAEKFTESPCLGTITKLGTNDYKVTCVELKKEKKTDAKDKTKDPKCSSCHLPKTDTTEVDPWKDSGLDVGKFLN